SLELMAEVILNPSFPGEELERQRRQRLDGILQERNSPPSIARRVFRAVLFGKKHPFGRDVAGHEGSIVTITRAGLAISERGYWKPNHSALTFAGDIDLDEAVRLADSVLGRWEQGNVPRGEMTIAGAPVGLRICLVDRQDAPQSQIRFGSIGPRRNTVDLYS